MFTFGTQYLRGATPARDQWAKDLENIKKMGFNTVRAWLVWNAIEPAEGEIDYDYISTFLKTAEENELQVGLLFHLHASPYWATKKYEKYYYRDEKNLPFEPAVRPNTPSGGWPGLCYDNEEVREMEARLIENVIKETKKYKCVSFYEPMNEPHQWVDYKRSPNGIFCYCDASVRKYREWLKKKYGDIYALNDAWGYFYRSFDEVRPPSWTTSYSDFIDFRLFNMDNVAEEVKFRTELIKKFDTKLVIAHAWGGGAVTCAQLGGMAFDDWKHAKLVDKWGYSAFPFSASDASSLGLGSNATRCAAGGKEYWQSELSAGLKGTGLSQQGRLDDKTFNNLSLESIRYGAKGLLYWQYRKERFGQEWGGFSMTDYGGGPTNLSECARKLCSTIQKNEDVFMNAKIDDAEIALVYSPRSFLANWASNWRGDNKQAVDSLSGYYRMFWEENIATDIIHEDDESVDLSKYKVVIAPSSYAISGGFVQRLEAYIKNGGTFISDPYFGSFDEHFRLSYEVPGYGFDKVFGCREFDLRQSGRLNLYKNCEDHSPLLLDGNCHMELFRDVTADVLYKYEDGTAAIVGNKYGKGYAVLSGVNLGLPYSNRTLISDDIVSRDRSNSSVAAKDIVYDIISRLGIRRNRCTTPGVKVSLLSANGASVVIAINSNSKSATGDVQLDRNYSSASVELGCADISLKGNVLCLTLNAGESTVIRLND